MNTPKFSYYFTFFPTMYGGRELDTLTVVDHEAVLREEAICALEGDDAEAVLSKKLMHTLNMMQLRARCNAIGSPVLHISSDEMLNREWMEAYVANTPVEELLAKEAKGG